MSGTIAKPQAYNPDDSASDSTHLMKNPEYRMKEQNQNANLLPIIYGVGGLSFTLLLTAILLSIYYFR